MNMRAALYACGVAVAALPAIAAPLRRADVPARPAWVLHLDCDALRSTSLGQFLLSEMGKPADRLTLAAFRFIFDFDPRTQLHGLTLYSTGQTPEAGVLLIYADFDPDRLIRLARAAKDAQSTPYKQNTIYNWIDQQQQARPGVEPRVYASIGGKHTLILAHQEERVAQALDVLHGAAPSLASSGVFSQLDAGGHGIFLQGAARKLDLPDATPNAALLRLARMARLQASETHGELKATLNLAANDDDVARQMAAVGQGLVTLMRLRKDDVASVRLAEALSLKQVGTGVVVSLALPSEQAIELIKANLARQAQQKTRKN
jgi:hypothetical protein